jgi:hypothetical protein
LIYYVNNTRVNKHLRTYGAGEVGAVNRGSLDRNPVIGSLDNDVLFCMKAATEFVSFPRCNPEFFPETANLETMIKA